MVVNSRRPWVIVVLVAGEKLASCNNSALGWDMPAITSPVRGEHGPKYRSRAEAEHRGDESKEAPVPRVFPTMPSSAPQRKTIPGRVAGCPRVDRNISGT